MLALWSAGQQAGPRSPALQNALLVAIGFLLGVIATSSFGRSSSCRDDDGMLHWWQGVPPPVPHLPPRLPVNASCATVLQSCTPPSVPAHPSLASYKKLPRTPAAAVESAALLREFEAAPWLLPCRTPSLPYSGVHEFDKLLRMRAQPAGGYDKAAVLLLFSAEWAVMAQNSIYSLVKHGGVRNYIAVTWTATDLAACADLNLPCANASGMLRRPIDKDKPTASDFVVMSWIKPAVLQRALEQGYVVMLADIDIAYTVKLLWESYMTFIEQAEADGAWLQEKPAPNTGHFVALPTQASLAFACAWNAEAPDMSGDKLSLTDQRALPRLEWKHFMRCDTVCRCLRTSWNLTQLERRDNVALFRTYLPGHYVYSPNWCTVGSPLWMPRIDPCDWHVLYLHPICIGDPSVKQRALQAAGFWFMDNEEVCRPQPGAASKVPACRPLQWRDKSAEAAHYSCPSYGPGLVHGGEPAGLQAVRSGVTAYSEKAAAELFGLDVYATLFC
ncbi:hypothetical protein ABPG75_011254 [Micractinium tetrahymenae]